MSVQVRARREAAAFLSTFVGAQGELLVDTTNNRVQVHDGATPGGSPAAKLSEVVTNTRAAVADASYTALATDRNIAVTSLTASRTITLPAASTYPTGTQLLVFDESGSCSASNSITIARAGADTINGATSAAIATAYGYLAFESNGVGRWTIVDSVPAASSGGGGGGSTATRTAVADANYTALTTDRTIGVTSLTAARTVTLPAAIAYPVGVQLFVVDESGACNATRTITLAAAGSDAINGATAAVIGMPYGFIAVSSNGSGKWTVVDQSTASMAQQAASGVGITGGTIDGTVIGATARAAGAFTSLTSNGTSVLTNLPGALFGLALANSGTTSIVVSPGAASNDDGSTLITIPTSISKTMGAWTAGSGNGGLDTGTSTANTWYHVFLISNPSSSAIDVLFSTSVSAPTLPSNYTKKRRIGSVLTTGTATNFTSFVQVGDDFFWATSIQNASAATLAVNTSATLALSTPPSVRTKARISGSASSATAGGQLVFTPLDKAVPTVLISEFNLRSPVASQLAVGSYDVLTDTAQSVRVTALGAAIAAYTIYTSGWIDTRGK